jgi:hypothetical protein
MKFACAASIWTVAMSLMTGPDGRPASFDGAAWVSRDGKFWWNGAVWVPLRRKFRPNFGLIGGALALVAGAWLAWNFLLPMLNPPPMGVTNQKIDSATRVEFDYARDTACSELTFRLVFYDSSDNQIQVFDDSTISSVPSDKTVHFTLNISPALPAAAVRFDADPACHG